MEKTHVDIHLTQSEYIVFGYGGHMRTMSAAILGRQLDPSRKDEAIESHFIGALSEAALAKYLNVFYCPLVGALDTNTGDVADQYQVKSTRNTDGNLIIKHNSPVGFPYVLAIVMLRLDHAVVSLWGWIYGHEARGLDDPGTKVKDCYFIPKAKLRPMDTLKTETLVISR